MEWVEAIGDTLEYIESNLCSDLSAEFLSRRVHIPPFYFQKGFSLLCQMTLGEYVRKRRLDAAGTELAAGDAKVIDVALKYGYDSPDSFAKAFTRFHSVSPAMAHTGATLRSFAPLKIKLTMEGGYSMEYKIVAKDSFTVVGHQKTFAYENAKNDIPAFWQQHFAEGGGKYVCGMYGVNIDESMGGTEFIYLIADDYKDGAEVSEGYTKITIPAFTWAVFPSRGSMPETFQNVNTQIFSQ